MKICFLYGGQGSQKKGMGKDFYEKYPVFRDFYDSINLHFDLKNYSFEKSDEEIAQTQYTQPIMVAFQIGVTKLLKDKGISPDISAGLSIGEYSALYASGILSDKDAVTISEKRGLAMAKKGDITCTMMAIIGADPKLVDDTCKDVSKKGNHSVEISNLNCPGQIVIAGEENAVAEAVGILKENGVRRALPLRVSNAFHTSYMQEASEKLEEIFKDISFKKPIIPIGLNLDASIYTPERFNEDECKKIMVQQVKRTVRFGEELEKIIDYGADVFVEIGFSSVIKGFLSKIDKDKKVYEVYNLETLNNFLSEFKDIS